MNLNNLTKEEIAHLIVLCDMDKTKLIAQSKTLKLSISQKSADLAEKLRKYLILGA